MLGGNIEASSVQHQGSTFTVRLPAYLGGAPLPDRDGNTALHPYASAARTHPEDTNGNTASD
jgi:hypothetical protein